MDLMDYRRKIIANSPHLSSASGAVATFSDGTDLPLKSLLVNIDPVQSGTGDPSPTNIRSISGWNSVKVTRTGKNIFDNQFSNRTINGLTWVLNSDGTITVNGTATAETQLHTQFVSGIEGECFFSGCPSGGSSTSYDVFIWDVTNSSRAKKWNRTTTVDSELGEGNAQVYLEKGVTYRFCYRIRNGYTANNVLFSPMIRLASFTDHAYHPYNGVTVTIDLGQTVYGTTINPLTGVLTVDRAMVDLGTLTWNKRTDSIGVYFVATKPTGEAAPEDPTHTSMPFDGICSIYQVSASNNVFDGSIAMGAGNSTAIYVRDFRYTDASAFTTAIQGAQLCYKLKTPQTVQLTPQQIRSLYGNNTIFADTGNVALEYWAHP